jgi:hypothetical protein
MASLREPGDEATCSEIPKHLQAILLLSTKRIPSALIRDARVVGFTPSSRAAPQHQLSEGAR